MSIAIAPNPPSQTDVFLALLVFYISGGPIGAPPLRVDDRPLSAARVKPQHTNEALGAPEFAVQIACLRFTC